MDHAITRLPERITNRNLIRNIFSGYIPVLIISLLFIVPLTDSSKMFIGIVSAKKYYFFIFMLIIIVYTTIFFIYDKKFNHIALNKIDIAFLLYATWNLVSAVITNDSYINDKTAELIILAAYYFIIKVYLSVQDKHETFLNITSFVLLTVAIIESVIGLLQVYGVIPSNSPYFRITGTFHNPAPYALLLSVIFVYSLVACFLNEQVHRYVKYLSYISCFLILNTIPFTNNRTSWIGIGASIILVLFYYSYTRGYLLGLSRWMKISSVLLLIILAGISLLYLYNLKKDSSNGRLLVWKVSGKIIKDHLITGVGYGRFRSEYNLYQADYFKNNLDQERESLADDVQIAFNDFLETIVETGIIGLGLLVLLVISVLFVLKRTKEQLILYIIPFITIILLAFISYPINALSTKILLFFFISVISSKINYLQSNRNVVIGNRNYLIFFIAICFPLMAIQISKYQKYKIWLYAAKSYQRGNYTVSEDFYHQIYKKLKFERYHSIMYAECLIQNQKYNDMIKILSESKMITPCYDLFILLGNGYYSINEYSRAESNYKEANFMVPGRILPEYLLTKLYYETEKDVKADSIVNMLSTTTIKINSDSTQKLVKEIRKMYHKNKNINRLTSPDRGI